RRPLAPARLARVHDEPALALGREAVGRLPERRLAGHAPYTARDGALASRRRAAAPARVDEGPRTERRLALLRRQEADPRREPAHDLRGGTLPQHRRVLGSRYRDLPDPRRHLYARLPLLLRAQRQARGPARPARAATARQRG